MLTLDELRADVANEAVDTVVVAFTDMQGRLMGKRMHAEYSRTPSTTGSRAATTCSRSRWRWTHPGLRDRELGARLRRLRHPPDLDTLRRIPWLDATALVLGDVLWHDGEPCGRRRARS